VNASSPGGRTQAQRRAAAEAALLRAAAEVIAEQGVERASLRAISARAGRSRAMPGYHFGSKDALITRIVERGHGETMAAATAAPGLAGNHLDALPGLEALRLIIETYLQHVSSGEAVAERAVIVMWGASFPARSPVPAMAGSDRETHQYLADFIRAGQADGSVRASLDADAAAVLVMGMARGTAALLLTHPGTADVGHVRQLAGEAITASLRPRQDQQ